MNHQPVNRREFFQSIIRSRFFQILLAFSSLSLCIGLALILWHGRDLIVGILFVTLIIFGWHLACELLPFSEATRTRWYQSRELANRYPSYRFRVALWVGLGQATPSLWRSYTHGSFEPQEFLVSGFFVCVGAISYATWHLKHHNEKNANPNNGNALDAKNSKC